MSEPGEDLCLACRHPDHETLDECGAAMSTGRYGSDGLLVEAPCRCTGPAPAGIEPAAPDPWALPEPPGGWPPPPF